MRWFVWLGVVVVAVALLLMGLVGIGSRRWRRSTQALTTQLDAGRVPVDSSAARYHVQELEGLPAPVQRFFRAALTDGQPIITAVTIDMVGTFNLSATGAQWKPFIAQQHVATRRPGFVWDANIAMAPGVDVRVVDSYVRGHGLLHAAIAGLVSMADMQGVGEIARGEFMRWCAEVAWYPTALLPSQGVRWTAVDDHSANATFTDGPIALTLLFRFNEAGLIGSFRAEARGGMVGKVLVMAPWEGSWSNYQRRDGMQLPFTGEVAWMRPEGRKQYFIGNVTALTLRYAP